MNGKRDYYYKGSKMTQLHFTEHFKCYFDHFISIFEKSNINISHH